MITDTETTILRAAASIASDAAGRYSLSAYALDNGRDALSHGMMAEALRGIEEAVRRVEVITAVYFTPDDEPAEPQSLRVQP